MAARCSFALFAAGRRLAVAAAGVTAAARYSPHVHRLGMAAPGWAAARFSHTLACRCPPPCLQARPPPARRRAAAGAAPHAMASTLLEETRRAHDDVERLERLIVKDFASQPAASHKDKLLQAHRVRAMLDSIQERSAKLVSSLCVLGGVQQAGGRRGAAVQSAMHRRPSRAGPAALPRHAAGR